MAYLIKFDRDNEDFYKLYYGEPSNPFIITSNGTYYDVETYYELLDEEREEQSYINLIHDNFPLNGWADISMNNMGLDIDINLAEYLLEGKKININEPIEIGIVSYP